MNAIRKLAIAVGAAVALSGAATGTNAAVIYESASLGQTGYTYQQLVDGTAPATNVNVQVFTGVRFQLTQPVRTTQVGGHFVGTSTRTFFGAIVALTGPDDFPDSRLLTTPDVVATAILDFPLASGEAYGDLSVRLEPGWYALAFGSQRLGGFGAALGNSVPLGEPQFLIGEPNFGWRTFEEFLTLAGRVNPRLVVLGEIVPEPAALFLAAVVMASFAVYKNLSRPLTCES